MKQNLSPAAEGIRKLLANGKQHKALRENLQGGIPAVTRSVTPEEMEVIHRVRAAKARLAAQGNPLAGKRNGPDYLPTPERIAKGGLVEVIDQQHGRRYLPGPNIVERERGKLGGDLVEMAFDRLVEDAYACEITNVTINYQGAGTRTAGSKLGGLGAAQAEQIMRYARFQKAMDALTPRSRRIVEFLLLPRDSSVPPMTLEEIGRWIGTGQKDPHGLRQLGKGRLIGVGDELVKFYTDYDMETRVAELRIRDMRQINGGAR